jgi:hypothetical protein
MAASARTSTFPALFGNATPFTAAERSLLRHEFMVRFGPRWPIRFGLACSNQSLPLLNACNRAQHGQR